MICCPLLWLCMAAEPTPPPPLKAMAVKGAADRLDAAWAMAGKIWEFAEPGYLEKESSKLLANALEKEGFRVKRGVAGIPTAVVAEVVPGHASSVV